MWQRAEFKPINVEKQGGGDSLTETHVPVITGNYAPIRFVTRGASDNWNPTIEQLNRRDYDYVKLHRLSTFLDVNIRPYSMGICFDGTLVLPAIPKFRDR